MPLLIDSENIVTGLSDAPDKLRELIGLYYKKKQCG